MENHLFKLGILIFAVIFIAIWLNNNDKHYNDHDNDKLNMT